MSMMQKKSAAANSIDIFGDVNISGSVVLKDKVTGWLYELEIIDSNLNIKPVNKEALRDRYIDNLTS